MTKLANVRRGRIPGAYRFVFYGVPGVGKSSLAAAAPDPIFLDIEDGTALIDCARYPFRDGPGGHVAERYTEVFAALDDLLENDHPFRTVVIDTLEQLESLLWAYICARDSRAHGKALNSIEDYGWGKGYTRAVDEWRALAHKLDQLRTRRGMNIILLGHALISTFKNPEGGDYDRYTPRLHEKAAGFLRGWCDVMGFCCFESGAGKLEGEDRVKGHSTGRRLVQLERTAAYDAKNRLSLPACVELTQDHAWAPFAVAMDLAHVLADATPEQLNTLIDAELARIADTDLAAKVAEVRERVGDDPAQLARILTRLKRR